MEQSCFLEFRVEIHDHFVGQLTLIFLVTILADRVFDLIYILLAKSEFILLRFVHMQIG